MKNTQVQTARAAFATTNLPLSLNADQAESNIQFMPPGPQEIVCWVNDEPTPLSFTVTAKHAELFNGQLQTMLAKARAGQGDRPLIDYNHEDGAAAGRPLRIEWGGDDAKAGGIRLITKLTAKAKASVRDEEFDRFSPQWDFDKETHEPLLIKVNMGGLVNKAAFKNIATVKAKDATARADAADGDPDPEAKDCDQLSAAAHKASSKAYTADDEDAVNAHTAAHKAHLAAAGAMKAAGNPEEAAAHKTLAAIHKTKVMDITKTNLAAASAAASSANKPAEQSATTAENNMTEQEIATAVAKGVEAANKPLVAQITALETKLTGLEKSTATAQAKAAVQKHVTRGAIAPQDADTITFFETAFASDAAGTEKLMGKLPVVSRGRVIPQTTSATATAGAGDSPEATALAKARELRGKNPTAYASDAVALDAWLHSPEGNAAYAEVLAGRDPKRGDVRSAH
jgi:hypothetical protein